MMNTIINEMVELVNFAEMLEYYLPTESDIAEADDEMETAPVTIVISDLPADILRKQKARRERNADYKKAKQKMKAVMSNTDIEKVYVTKANGNKKCHEQAVIKDSHGNAVFTDPLGKFRDTNHTNDKHYKYTPNGENNASDLRKLQEAEAKYEAFMRGSDVPNADELEPQLSETELKQKLEEELQKQEDVFYASMLQYEIDCEKRKLKSLIADKDGQKKLIAELEEKLSKAKAELAQIMHVKAETEKKIRYFEYLE